MKSTTKGYAEGSVFVDLMTNGKGAPTDPCSSVSSQRKFLVKEFSAPPPSIISSGSSLIHASEPEYLYNMGFILLAVTSTSDSIE